MSGEQPTLRWRPSPDPGLTWWVGILALELALVVGYFGLSSARVTDLRYVVYPFVWINAGIWAVGRVSPPAAPTRRRWAAGLLAGGYALVLTYATGMFSVLGSHAGHGHSHTHLITDFSVRLASPGWGPIVTYAGLGVRVTLLPYRVVGYAVLAYLVYVTVLRASGAAVSGLLGFGACVSCAFPIVSALVIQTVGTTALAGAIYAHSVTLSTLVFLVTVGLLTYSAD